MLKPAADPVYPQPISIFLLFFSNSVKSGRKNYEGQCFRGGALPLPVGNILCDQKRKRTVLCLLLRGDKEPSLSLLSPYVCLGVDRGAIPQSGHLVRSSCPVIESGRLVRSSDPVTFSE